MPKTYELTKLSSGTTLSIISNEPDILADVLDKFLCEDCKKEADDYISEICDEVEGIEYDEAVLYVMLGTSCGAEFLLEER